jgi:hypothetical protein
VQRPLAKVIIWGLTGSTLFTLFVTPVFYLIFVPPLPGKGANDDSPSAPDAPPATNGEDAAVTER